jgi:exodeoxyribonuclease V beta subunit
VLDDEPAPPVAPGPAPPGEPVPLDAMPAGTQVGTVVHRVLEATDFAAGDLEAELAGRLAEAQAWRDVVGDPARVVAGLGAAVATPLGPLFDGVRLRDVTRADRLDELDFELPLAGGDDPSGAVALSAIAGVLRAHGEPYAERLEDPALRPDLRGYLTGILDLVVRIPGPRFAVLDYKTNRLAGPDEPLTAWHHRPEALAAEMHRAHYGLQALLYVAALHRYLRWRLPGYDPDRHLAGVGYLFLRGMTGAPGSGVFAWRPPGALVRALSDVLEGLA